MKKTSVLLTAFFLTLGYTLKAQTDFSLSGLGRVIVSDNNLKGDIVKNDLSTTKKGVGGYILFDLKPTLKINNNLHANAILRVRNPFGAYFGDQVVFQFRQFQIMGKVGKYVDYQIGDINVEMTPYTVHAFNEMGNQEFEAEAFKIRRSIVNYENMVIGNAWRLQGVQGFANIPVNKLVKKIHVNAFGVRTNATNESTIPDRILAGGRVIVTQSDVLTFGGNYVGMQDIPVSTAAYDYQNHVLTGDAKLTANKESIIAELKGETGISTYNYTNTLINNSVGYNDYFYDVKGSVVIKPAKIKVYAGYRNVGPQFSSPSAQTARINMATAPALFDTIKGQSRHPREQVLYDRFTQENIYNRSINPILYPYVPAYNLIYPYGDATPNRQGFTAGIATDTSSKIVMAEVRVDAINEIIGEGVKDKRSFLGVRGGVVVELGKLLDLDRKISINAGAKYEKSKRSGLAPIEFKNMLVDAGFAVEVIKKFDLLGGVKVLNASGTEYLTVRDQYNRITSYNSFTTFPVYNVDLIQAVYTAGARVRFASNSYFSVNYNLSSNKNKISSANDSNISQFFFNYTLIIP